MRAFRKLFLSLVLLGSVWAQALSSTPAENEQFQDLPICYIPGAGGGSEDAFNRFPKEMAQRGIRFLTFDIGNVGTVVERATKLARLLETELEKTPSFRCHFYSYSMGGIVSRYLYSHAELVLKDGKKLDARQVMASLTTFSSPHRGTPLADYLIRYAPKYAVGMDDLSEARIKIYNDPAFPETYSPIPTGIPVYSYLTYLERADETSDFLGKIGFKIIWETYNRRNDDPRNDGIIPLLSQAVGKAVMTIRAPHGFFSSDVGLRPWAPDVFEAQYHTLNKSISSRLARNRIEELLTAPHVKTRGLDPLQNLEL